MKKVLALIMALLMVLSLAACGGKETDSDSTTSSKTDTSSYKEGEKELTDAQIKSKVEQAILDEVKSRYSAADPYSTTYKIANKETKGDYIYVYGTVTLYDKYGQITTGHSDGSGSYSRTFEVKLKKNGTISDCE